MNLHEPNTHEAPLLDSEARFSTREPFEMDDGDQSAPQAASGLPSYRSTKPKSQRGRSMGGLFQGWKVILFDSCKFACPVGLNTLI
jgi:hypothetical protein